ncbi:hypothetical protein [uncultured Sphingomonas sp.]|uniref:hypothetical protein n=1 Tax=uncultured Sphingomonas sp. TaxID=158754 RepID=UPI0025F40106|nr:hypothetical protein [uncultured Sphingomonas sp.]
MIIDAGEQLPLHIHEVFEGVCGVARGMVAFTPNLTDRAPGRVHGALLNGRTVILHDIEPAGDDRSYIARYRYTR